MRSRLVLCAGLLLLFLCSLCYSGTVPTLDQILLQVQDHVKEFEFSLPDFTCNERITSRQVAVGKIRDQSVVNSVFSGRQNKDEKDKPFTESREIKTIDGTPAGRRQQLEIPVFFGGGFSSVLEATFGEKNIQYHNYKIMGTEKVDGKPALVIKFATKEDQKEVCFEFMGRKFISRDTGKAWIDLESMEVVRLERRYLNLPPPYGVLAVSVDYARVVINGRAFWMPRTVRAEQTQARSKTPVTGHFIAEYSNYQKFNVSVQMKY